MKAVLDTNAVVSAILRPASKPGLVLDMALAGEIELVASEHLLAEYSAVLQRPRLAFDSDLCTALVAALRARADVVAASAQRKFTSPDPKDQPVLDLAVAGDAILVSGNARHFPAYPKLVSPAGFLQLCRKG